jgi:hypothetical protein
MPTRSHNQVVPAKAPGLAGGSSPEPHRRPVAERIKMARFHLSIWTEGALAGHRPQAAEIFKKF